jgi:hypothetical protein
VKTRTRVWSAAAFGVCVVVVGVPYWRLAYRDVSLPSSLMGPGVVAVGLAACLLRASGAASWRRAVVVAGSAMPAVVLARVSVETGQDPTSHNLWPFELVIALGVGFLCSTAGALVGSAIGAWTHRRSPASSPHR